jgi:hypothetical protein
VNGWKNEIWAHGCISLPTHGCILEIPYNQSLSHQLPTIHNYFYLNRTTFRCCGWRRWWSCRESDESSLSFKMCLSDKTHILITRVSYGAKTQYSSVMTFCVLMLRHTFNVTNLVNALIYKLLRFTS